MGRTIAETNEMRRKQAIEAINDKGLENFLQVAGTKYAIDTVVDGAIAPIRVDIVAMKDTGEYEEFTAQTMHDTYLEEQETKRIQAEEKAQAKAKKITKDKAKRAKEKEEKGE